MVHAYLALYVACEPYSALMLRRTVLKVYLGMVCLLLQLMKQYGGRKGVEQDWTWVEEEEWGQGKGLVV